MTVEFPRTTLFIDVESCGVEFLGKMPPEEYIRLIQYAWGEQAPVVSTSLAELKAAIRRAKMVVGANILDFDLRAIYGDTRTGLKLAQAGRILDTHVHALTAFPPPFGKFRMRDGRTQICTDPPHYRRWIKLDNLAFQLGVPGKLGDLSDIVDEFTHEMIPTYSEKTGKRLKNDKKVKKAGVHCGFCAVPIDHPEYVEYARQDIVVVREVARKLLELEPYSPYTRYEMAKTAAWIHVGKSPDGGLKVDLPATRQREKDLHEEAAWTLNWLRDTHNFPMSGKKPLASKDGKDALLRALASVGVPEAIIPRTTPSKTHPTGQPSFSAENVLAVTSKPPVRPKKLTAGFMGRAEETEELAEWDGPDPFEELPPFDAQAARKLGEAVATLAGQRSLAELLLKEVEPDGRVRPDVFPLQRSGRNSTTNPGLTIWDPRFKDLLIADDDDHLLVEFDYSNADARAVAAMSGDAEFAKRFEPGQDGHLINAHLLWGADKVGWDKKDPVTAKYRFGAKAPGHGIGYNMGPTKMAETTGLTLAECKRFIKNYREAYPGVTRWQKRVVGIAQRFGYVISDWGRRMAVESGREHTQTPGVLGQNVTHEILSLGLLRCDDRHRDMIRLGIHDAFLASIPIATMEADISYFVETFSMTWHPKGGQAVDFTLGYGEPARNWFDAQH